MTNIEKWPEAFENGIPKVGGRWIYKTFGQHTITGIDWPNNLSAATFGEAGSSGGYFLERYASEEAMTFLGFADSVNQGAAAPQKPVEKATCMMLNSSPLGGTCGKPSAWHWMSKMGDGREYFFCAACSYTTQSDQWSIVPIAAPAPIVGPPPSLRAAVQQEGLSIPPQVGTRHEYWEASARGAEGRAEAKTYAAKARAALAADLAYDAEADAIRENRVIKKIALQEMGRGDRECFKLRNLREFTAIKSAEHALWNWWGKP